MKPVLILIAALSAASAFNSEQFLSKYCVTNKFYENLQSIIDLYCSNVELSPEERHEIQNEDFVITNHKRIVFEGGDLDVVNVNFLKKFPKTEEIMFSNTSIKLINQIEVVDSELPLETIYIADSKVYGTNNTNLFNSLLKLKQLSMSSNAMEQKTLTKEFLGRSPHLTYIHIFGYSFDKIDEDAFEDLPNLDMLNLESLNLTSLPNSIRNLSQLTWINLSENKLTVFPRDVLPSSLEEISLLSNYIKHVSKEDFKSFPSLTKLLLVDNLIEKLDEDTFEDLGKLEELALDGNKLSDSSVSKTHFEKLKNLKGVNLDRNFINVENTDLKDFEIVTLKDQKVA